MEGRLDVVVAPTAGTVDVRKGLMISRSIRLVAEVRRRVISAFGILARAVTGGEDLEGSLDRDRPCPGMLASVGETNGAKSASNSI